MSSRHSILALAALLPLLSCTAEAQPEPITFQVISDLHVDADVPQSITLLDSALCRITQRQPHFLLITGDLTDRGDTPSQQLVSQKLDSVESAGIAVYVIPGNHDILSTDDPLTTFAQQYAAYGYDEAVMRHPSSLSYLAYPAPGIALLCLDSTRPAQADGKHHSDGGLTLEQTEWAQQAAARAQADGRTLIGMMHHPVTEHFSQHARLADTYLANTDSTYYPTLATVQQQLVQAGIHTMFTGHFHALSCSHVDTGNGLLTDVMTGSLANYPSPIRTATLDYAQDADSGSKYLALALATDTLSLFRTEQMQHNDQLINSLLTRGVNRAFPMLEKVKASLPGIIVASLRLPESKEQMLEDMQQYLRPALLDVYNAFALGDEDQHDPDQLYANAVDALHAYTLYICKGNQLLADLLTEGLSNSDDLDENYLALFDVVLRSVCYNYVSDPTDVVPDGNPLLRLPQPPASLPVVSQPSATAQHYQIDGKPFVAAATPTFVVSQHQVRMMR